MSIFNARSKLQNRTKYSSYQNSLLFSEEGSFFCVPDGFQGRARCRGTNRQCSGSARRRWLRCFFCKTASSANRDQSQILIRDYRWKMCRTPRDSDSDLLMHTAVLSSLGRPRCCSHTSLAALKSECYHHN